MREPAARWSRWVGWTLTVLAAALNVVSAPGVVKTVGKVQNSMGVLWLFSTHVALLLALTCVLVPRFKGLTVTRRGAISWLLLALLSLVTWPLSYAATQLLAYGGFNRLF